MLVTTELRSRAWRSNAASVRLRRSNHTATGRPTSSTPTSRTNRSPRDDVIAEGEFSIGCPFEMARSRRIQAASLFDHLVGEREQLVRNCEAERLRGLDIECGVKMRRRRPQRRLVAGREQDIHLERGKLATGQFVP